MEPGPTSAPAPPDDPARAPLAPGSAGRGAVLLLVARFGAIAATAVAGIVIARALGPAGAGTCALALTSIAVLVGACGLGVGTGTAWQVGGGRWTARSAALTTQAWAAASGLAIAAVAFGVAALGGGAVTGELGPGSAAVVLATLPATLMWTNAANVAVASRQERVGALLPGLQTTSYAGGVLVGVSAGVDGVLTAFLASQALTAAAGLWWTSGLPRRPGREVDGARLRRALAFGTQTWAAQLLALVVRRVDVLLLGATASQAAVGHYAVAIAATAPLLVLPSGISSVLVPRSAALAQDPVELERSEGRALRHAVLLLGGCAVGLAVVVLLLLTVLYGPAFAASRTPALVLLPGTVAFGVTEVARAALVGRGRPRLVLATWAPTLPIALALYALLIPPYGATGAALASSLSYGLACAVALALLGRASGVPTARRILPGRAELADYRGALAGLRRR